MLYLSQSDLIGLGAESSQIYVDAITEGLALHARGEAVQPLKPYLRWPDAPHIADRIIAMPCYLGGERPVAGIKWVGSREANPRERGLPRASALIVLNDAHSNYPVAIMEGALISGMRTAAVTAVAARHLALPGFSSVSCIGCGPIARMQLITLLEQFSGIERVHLYDHNGAAAVSLKSSLEALRPGLDCVISQSAREAVGEGELVVTCTTADKPYIEYDWLRPGAFVSNVSIMDVHKEVFERADKVVVDDWEQSNREKKIIHQLVLEGRFSREKLHAELGELVLGTRPGREWPREIILLNAMGMAVDDLVCARRFYEKALEQSAGTKLPLF
ncbi:MULTISPECIES: 2,3-diaminopropionate biosynthesis protein SbnB [unclassified Microbulbifer]|uniref:2,3-diaminopropionate biosynthesis protein SbnB n=1 Tax=unclassified Microbulbifer TaxID=2619833 RepID=UPI0027E46F60|nr:MULTISPECIES: 2,3-diaminopropionate biosynthesis protein SbnB [unclassified Microbulbifer]